MTQTLKAVNDTVSVSEEVGIQRTEVLAVMTITNLTWNPAGQGTNALAALTILEPVRWNVGQ